MAAKGKVQGTQQTQDALQDALLGGIGEPARPYESLETQPSPSSSKKRTQPMDREGEQVGHVLVRTQTTLASRVHSQSWVRERKSVAEMEIARTH